MSCSENIPKPIKCSDYESKKLIGHSKDFVIKDGKVRLKRKYGKFKRQLVLVIIVLILSSCSSTINLTQTQKETRKHDRFKIAPKELLLLSGAAFVGYGLGKKYRGE